MKKCYKKSLISLLGIIATGAVIMAGLAGCNTLQSIEVSKEPARTVYGQGQQLDISGLAVMAHYKKNSEEVTSSLQISGYNPGQPGQQTVTVILKKQSATFTVTVVPVVKVTIQQPPATTVFMQGDNVDYAGLVALAEFENGAVPGETIGPEQLRFSGYNKDTAGVQALTADYYGKQASFNVRVAGITGITVRTPPDNIDYFTGEDLNLTGLVVIGTWEGMGERPLTITQGNLSSFDKNRAGRQNVVVTYQGKTASFPVTFVAMQVVSIDRPPAKLNYENGEELDLAGLRVQATRTGATSMELVDISRLRISGYDRFKGGNQTITVTIGGKTDTFRVTVAPNPFVGTWHGMWRYESGQEVTTAPVTLIMTEDSWSVTISEFASRGSNYNASEFSGTYTRDTDSGKHATLVLNKGDRNFGPRVADILSPAQVKLSGGSGWYFTNGVTLTK
jgi:hypothetical protein